MVGVRHNCGLALATDINDLYKMGAGIQHRGREATGLFAMRRDPPHTIDCIKWLGPIERFTVAALKAMLPEKNYKFFGLHTRYATRGRKDRLLYDAHPHTIGGKKYSYGDYEIIHGAIKAILHNGQVNFEELREEEVKANKKITVDKDLLKFECDTESLLHYYDRQGVKALFENIPGAFTIIIADSEIDTVFAGRDCLAMKPGVIGERNGNTYVASENAALHEVGALTKETLTPGKMYTIREDGSYRKKRQAPNPGRKMCFFEANYIMSKESQFQHCHVNTLRGKLGVALSEEFSELKEDHDLVTFIPNCPSFAADRFANKLRMPLVEVFVKPKKTRSFQGSNQEERVKAIKSNLIIPPHITNDLKGKNVLVVDDSFIRGTNSKRAIQMLRETGVKKITLLSYTPIIGAIGEDGTKHGCTYGVDMPPEDDFLVRDGTKNRSLQSMAEQVGADAIYFLSTKKMFETFEQVGLPKEFLCAHCIGGPKPF